MSTKLFRSVLLGISLTAMLVMALVAYGRRTSEVLTNDEECCLQVNNNHNTDLPWEKLASQWFRSVSF
ncbi:hypothetical protein [Paracnuella aquatica]|uniref:hypothetical protein n=1 Tax=Paracnuella aquatica TaxID=2268757 RepID=UPI000F50DDF1|nr:hypothetical protein [Paracnuella aquatica]RPD43518.1 hypothetical protein DRJ53_19735 [Paracnuella aquatica]